MRLPYFFTLHFLLISFAFAANAQEPRSSGVIELQQGFSAIIVLSPNAVILQMEGPADRWLALGFNAQAMNDGTDVVFYAAGANGETLYDGHLIGQGAPEEDTEQNWVLLNNTVAGNVRTIAASRVLDTGDPDDFVFDYDALSLPIIWSRGATATVNLGYHQSNRGPNVAQFTPVSSTGQIAELENEIKLYPNPASDEINVEFEKSSPLSAVRIFDSNARLVHTIEEGLNQGSLKLSLELWPAGLYYLEATTEREKALLRFVVEN